jgi:hypothetical protein
MADWKQITARIRRARTSKDPAGQLAHLYEKTRDAMVAFELAKYFESASQIADAVKWYSAAGENFRRADWKAKAQEAIVRLGSMPLEAPADGNPPLPEGLTLTPHSFPAAESEIPVEQKAEALESIVAVSSEVLAASENSTNLELPTPRNGKRRRRGRRGGKNRNAGTAAEGGLGLAPRIAGNAAPERPAPATSDSAIRDSIPSRTVSSRAMPALPVETLVDLAGPSVKGRYGDPGLSSRLTLLEMQFRRLMSCSPATLTEADRAPAGPGVFVITDSDLTTYYYVEACQTLRIAIGNLMRTGSNRRGADSIKPRLAEHLGIPEARVSKYLAEHCVVRWLQLDEGASNFAHFVVAVLRPTLND